MFRHLTTLFPAAGKVFLLLGLTVFILSCSDDDSGGGSTKADKIRKTAIIYMAADNSLGYSSYARYDSAEISAGTVYMNTRDQVLLYYDNGSNTRIYRFYKGSTTPQLVRQFSSNLCSSSPHIMKDVLSWIKTTYPSESYGLTCWSHGDGWLPSFSHNYSQASTAQKRSFGIDCGPGGNRAGDRDATGYYGAAMDMDSLAWAIENSGLHMDYIFFDACLMQCLESDYDLRNVTDYIVASPIATAAIGANYTSLIRSGLFSDNPDDIAQNVYNYMQNLPSQYSIYNDYGVVISTVKTSELEALAALTEQFMPGTVTGKAEADMSDVQRYSYYSASYFYRPEFYDAACAMKVILPEDDYALWKAQWDKCIVGKYSTDKFYYDSDSRGNDLFITVDKDAFSGVSMFVPQNRYTTNARRCLYGDLNLAFQKTAWYKDSGWSKTGW